MSTLRQYDQEILRNRGTEQLLVLLNRDLQEFRGYRISRYTLGLNRARNRFIQVAREFARRTEPVSMLDYPEERRIPGGYIRPPRLF